METISMKACHFNTVSQPEDLDRVVMVEYNPKRNKEETYELLNKYPCSPIIEDEEEDEDENEDEDEDEIFCSDEEWRRCLVVDVIICK